MNTSFRSAVCLAACVCAAVPFTTKAEEAPAPVATFVEPTSTEAKPYRSTGEYAIDRLVMTMITDSAAAVSKQEEVAALSTFHLRDLPKKDGTIAGLPRIVDMKLTSLKVRNPKNAPDAAEKLALKKVQVDLDVGNPPRVLVQKIEQPGGAVEWRVYKPLANIKQCGSCHGKLADMAPELRTAIAKAYPEDKGYGFQTGEWRGLFRVTVAPPEAKAAAK